MLLERLLDHFDTYTVLHIDVNAVRDQLVDMGIADQIRFHFVDLDKAKIRGFLHRYERHVDLYAPPVICADIVIAVDMGEEDEAWKRLVAVKELIHITDCPTLSAESEAAVDHLYSRFSVPPELRTSNFGSQHGEKSFFNDEVRIYAALAVLVPQGCRDLLRQLVDDDKFQPWEVASLAKVPVRYIETILKPSFDDFVRSMIQWEKAEQQAERDALQAAAQAAIDAEAAE